MDIPTGGTDLMPGTGTDLIMVGTLTGMIHGILHFIMDMVMVTPDSMEVLVFIALTMVLIGITVLTGMAITETVTTIMVITVAEI